MSSSISNYVDMNLIIMDADSTVSDAVKKMESHGTECVLVRDQNEVRGIITYKDVLYQVVAKDKDPTKTSIKEIMKTPLFTIQKNSTVNQAIQTMTAHNVRRLIVYDANLPIGIISQKALVGNLAKQKINLPELEIPNKFKCPYCSSIFDSKDLLSAHIDDIHVGRGLFEGNLSKAEDLGTINPPFDFPKTL